MRLFFVFIELFFMVLTMTAQDKINITNEFAITIPKECNVSFDDVKHVMAFHGKDYSCDVAFLPFSNGFSTLGAEWKDKRKLDTLFFADLRKMELIKKEKNRLFDFGHNFMKKYYYSMGDVYDVTYITHTTEGMYLFRFTTIKESTLPIFDEMIDSIDYYRGNLLRRTRYALSMSPIILIMILMLSFPCALLHRKGEIHRNLRNAVAIFVIVAGVICWGFDWDMGLMAGPLLLSFLTAVCCSVFGFYLTFQNY